MARKRMISATLGESHKFSRLQNDTHRLMYILIITHTDVEGRVDADPVWLNGKVFTRIPYSFEDIEAALHDLANAGLIHYYEADGKPYLQIVDFRKYNKVREDREADSEIPPPEKGTKITPPDNSGSTPGGRPPILDKTRLDSEIDSDLDQSSKRDELAVPTQQSMSPKGDASKIDYQEFIDVYNENCGDLPGVTKLTKKRRRSIGRLVKEHGQAEALGLLYDATRLVAMDEYWNEKSYNLDNLLVDGRVVEKAEKQRAGKPNLNRADRKLVNRYQETMDALGDFA